jgi:hypothetical protein
VPGKLFSEVDDRNDNQNGRFDSHSLLSPRGGPLMGTLTIFSFGGPSSTSLKSPLVEKHSAGSTNYLNGGLGASCNAPVVPVNLTRLVIQEGVWKQVSR